MRFSWQHLPISLQSTRYFSSLPSRCSSILTRPVPSTSFSTSLNAPLNLSSFSSRCSPAFSSNLTRPTPSTPSSTPLNLLYLNVSHSPNSLVAVGAQALLEGIKREHKVQEVDLWSKKDLKYSIEHVQAKLAMLGGAATREEEERFAPVMTAAEEVNRMDIVLIATPMWNYSVPYPLKQWIDTVVQPGINFSDSGQKLPGQGTREGKERALVVISSAGGVYKGEGSDPVQDYLNPYLRQVFLMMGFERCEEIFIQGTVGRERREKVEWTVKEARRVARILNQL